MKGDDVTSATPAYAVTGDRPKVRHIIDPRDTENGIQSLCNLFRYRPGSPLRLASGRTERALGLCGGCMKSLRSEKYLAA